MDSKNLAIYPSEISSIREKLSSTGAMEPRREVLSCVSPLRLVSLEDRSLIYTPLGQAGV